MEDSQVIVQTTCSVSLSTEGSIIPFTPGDVYLCASDNTDVSDLWCLVVLHKRNFPRKYSIIRQLTKITVRNRGSKIGFIVIEFDDTNQVRLKDFPTEPTYIARILKFCFENKDDPQLVEHLKDEKLREKLFEETAVNGNTGNSLMERCPIVVTISPDSSSRGSIFETFGDDQSCSSMDSNDFRSKSRRSGFTTSAKRSLDTGCITPPVRCIASIEETRVINEADVEDIPEKDQVTHSGNNATAKASLPTRPSSKLPVQPKQKITLNRGYHSVGGSPVSPVFTNGDFLHPNGDVLSITSSHGSTPPREFVVSEFDANNCGADITVCSQSPEKILKKGPAQAETYTEYPKYSTFNFPASSPSPPLTNFPDVNRRTKRRLTTSATRHTQDIGGMVTHESLTTVKEPPSKDRRRILSDGTSPGSPCKRSNFVSMTSKRSRSRLKSMPALPSDKKFSSYLQRMQYTLCNESKTEPESKPASYDLGGYARRSEQAPWPDQIIGGNHEDITPSSFLPATIIESLEPLSSEDQIHTVYHHNHLDVETLDTIKPEEVEVGSPPQLEVGCPPELNVDKVDNNMDHLKPDHVDLDNLGNGTHVEEQLSGQVFNSNDLSHDFFQKVVKAPEEPPAPEKRTLRPRTEEFHERTPPPPPPTQGKKVEREATIVGPGAAKPHGFVNLGNTCYMNCVLQCVLTVPSFKSLLRVSHSPFTPSLFNCLAALLQYKATIGGTKEKKELLIKVKNLISDATSLFKGSRQQDAHEFLGKFLDVLREERKYSLKCPVSRTFQCEVVHTLRCVSCRAGGQKTEMYYDFSLNLPGRNLQPHNLAELLESYFATDVVELKCSSCGHNSAQVQHRFSQLPQTLVLHVQRYAFSRSGSREGKRQDSVLIPPKLDITKLGKDCIKDSNGSRVSIPDGDTPALVGHNLRARTKGLYTLHAVISHLGESRECGHYICDVRERGEWYYYDDMNMHLVDLPYVRSKRKKTCYLFFYLREDNLHEG